MSSMEATQHSGRIFRGWWIVMAAAVGLFMGYVPIIGFTFSVFFRPLSLEFGWSRSEISLAFSLSLLALSVALPLSGRLVDRIGARRVILPAALLFGLGLASFYFLSKNLWHLYSTYLFLGLVGSGTASVPYFKVISRWFNKRRGLALGVTMAGTGTGTFLMPLWAQSLIATAGWRWAYVVIGAAVAAVTLPVVGLFLKERPENIGLLLNGANTAPNPESLGGITSRQARRSRPFWVMSFAFFLVSLSLNAFLIHIVPMLTDRGISANKAAVATSLIGGGTLLGRVFTGYLLDRFLASSVAAGVFCGAALGVLLLWVKMSIAVALLGAFLLGLGLGAEGDIMAYLTGRQFGLRAFGEIYGSVLTIYTVGAMIGPYLMGLVFDKMRSYELTMGPAVASTLVAAALMTRLKVAPRPEELGPL
jgi:MFS family permease